MVSQFPVNVYQISCRSLTVFSEAIRKFKSHDKVPWKKGNYTGDPQPKFSCFYSGMWRCRKTWWKGMVFPGGKLKCLCMVISGSSHRVIQDGKSKLHLQTSSSENLSMKGNLLFAWELCFANVWRWGAQRDIVLGSTILFRYLATLIWMKLQQILSDEPILYQGKKRSFFLCEIWYINIEKAIVKFWEFMAPHAIVSEQKLS